MACSFRLVTYENLPRYIQYDPEKGFKCIGWVSLEFDEISDNLKYDDISGPRLFQCSNIGPGNRWVYQQMGDLSPPKIVISTRKLMIVGIKLGADFQTGLDSFQPHLESLLYSQLS